MYYLSGGTFVQGNQAFLERILPSTQLMYHINIFFYRGYFPLNSIYSVIVLLTLSVSSIKSVHLIYLIKNNKYFRLYNSNEL